MSKNRLVLSNFLLKEEAIFARKKWFKYMTNIVIQLFQLSISFYWENCCISESLFIHFILLKFNGVFSHCMSMNINFISCIVCQYIWMFLFYFMSLNTNVLYVLYVNIYQCCCFFVLHVNKYQCRFSKLIIHV